MKTIEEEGYKYLGILEYEKVKEKEMKIEFVREYKRRIWLILISKFHGKNKIKSDKQQGCSIVEIWCWSVRMES